MPSNSQWTRLRSADKRGGEVTCVREREREGERVGGHDAGEVNGRDTLVPVAAALMARSVRRYCVHSAGLFAFNIASARALGGLGGGAHSRCVEARCFAERPEAMLAGRCAVRVPLATRTRSGYGSRRSGSARPSCSLTTCVGRGCCPLESRLDLDQSGHAGHVRHARPGIRRRSSKAAIISAHASSAVFELAPPAQGMKAPVHRLVCLRWRRATDEGSSMQ